jgi:hypothetical protein
MRARPKTLRVECGGLCADGGLESEVPCKQQGKTGDLTPMCGDWQGAGLVKESVLKPVFTTIEQGLVLRVMGHLSAADGKTLREVLGDVIR